jgi:hypothetical protein
MCRKKTETNPSKLTTDNSVFDDFISCLHCKRSITKADINISLTTYDLYCKNCGLGDISLYDFFSYLESDLDNFLKECEKQNIKQELENKLKAELDVFFNNIIEQLKMNLLMKLEKEIEQKFQYKITDDYNTFINYVNQLKVLHNSISTFNKNNEKDKLNLNALQNNIKYYTTNFDNIKNEKAKYENVYDLLNGTKLLSLNQIISNNDINNFFVNIFETFTADHKEQIDTGIHYFDKEKYELMLMVDQLKKQVNQLKTQIAELNKNNNNNKKDDNNNFGVTYVNLLDCKTEK